MLTIKRCPTIVSIYQDGLEKPGCGRNCLGACCIPGDRMKGGFLLTHSLNRVSRFESGQQPGAKLPVYTYGRRAYDTDNGSLHNENPFLDSLLLAQWEDRLTQGHFRYDVTACETKVLPGDFGFIAQLNEGRHLKKRPTECRVDQVLQFFDAKKFNFTKVGQEEVLFCFEESKDDLTAYYDEMIVGGSPNIIAINISPIEYGHVLLVPKVSDCKPQRIDEGSFRLALYMAAEAANPYFRVGYNSLGAFATVNHLHFQAYYLAVPFPVERAPITKIWKKGGVNIFELYKYPVKGLVYECGTSLDELADLVSKTCISLQEQNIPFNVLIAECGQRIFLFPQCFAERQALGQVEQDILDTQVNPAVWEISGHIVLKRKCDYESASEDYAWKLLGEVSLSDDRFDEVKQLCMSEAVVSKNKAAQIAVLENSFMPIDTEATHYHWIKASSNAKQNNSIKECTYCLN
eukprot:c29257_g1_i3 orf=562-1944(-)